MDPPTTTVYTLSLHDALPIFRELAGRGRLGECERDLAGDRGTRPARVTHARIHQGQQVPAVRGPGVLPHCMERVEGAEQHQRSEEHTSELQSRPHLVCRLLLE